MLRPCLTGGQSTTVAAQGEGQSCAVIVAQPSDDPGGWYFQLQAECEQGFFLVRRFFLAPPYRVPSRVVATCTFPTARRWQVVVQPPEEATRPIRVALAVSDQCFSPAMPGGAEQPGSKGWSSNSDSVPGVITLPPGARVRHISAIGVPAGTGNIVFTVQRDAVTQETLASIPLPAASAPGCPFEIDREALGDSWIRSIAFNDVASYFVAWEE